MLTTNLLQLLYKAFFVKPLHLNGKTATIGSVVHSVGTGLADLVSAGTYTAEVDHIYTIVMQACAYVIGAVSFSGGGLNDATSGGTFAPDAGASANHTYVVTISATGTPDHFTYTKDGGAPSAPIAITGAPQALDHGVTIAFNASTGHALTDNWTITVTGTDAYKFKTDSGALGGNTPVTGAAQTLANGVTVTFGATVGHAPADQFTISVKGGVTLPTAQALSNITVNSVGTAAELRIYDGQDSTGTLLYDGKTANWAAGQQIPMGYELQSGLGLYIELYDSGTYPDLIVGYN